MRWIDIYIKKYFFALLFSIFVSLFLTNQVDAHTIASVSAEELYLTPGGETIGIELQTNVVIVETYSVDTEVGQTNPAKNAGIKSGDIILYIDGNKINQIMDVKTELRKYNGGQNKPMDIIIKRDNKLINKKMYPVKTNKNIITLGIYLRDNIMGIGTLTFIYDNSYFGALGHHIEARNASEINTEGATGTIKNAEVTNINKSTRGNPGEKRAVFNEDTFGEITTNTTTGIYGKIVTKDLEEKPKMKIATQKAVRLGNAKILTVLSNHKIEEFDVKIIELTEQDEKGIKGIKLQITDERLLSKAGGIIQGMSGSPIIQNDRIIGAVTHVLVDEPTIGYGVYIEFMLEDLGISIRD